MPRGSKPGERRGGRQKGTPNKKTALKNAVLCAAASDPNTSPLTFMLGLMRDPNVPWDVRVDMAAEAARFVHAKPQAPPRLRTNPMDLRPLKNTLNFTAAEMEGELTALDPSVDGDGDVSPLNFLLSVMKDPDSAPQLRIKAAQIAARYKHPPKAPDKMPAVDEYGFSISRTLAEAIRNDWYALRALEISSKAAPKRAEILARQAERDEYLRCPAGYSPEQDIKRRDELIKKRPRSRTDETELGFIIARITASEVAFNRSPEGQVRRRMADLQYRRDAANAERNRRVGLTRAEGKELDDLLKQYPPKELPSSPLFTSLRLSEGWKLNTFK